MIETCVVLLSGGLDSATTLAIARGQGLACHCLTVHYGQRHEVELEAAKRVASALGAADHLLVEVSRGAFEGSALTSGIEVPKNRNEATINTEIPVTYVPARNTVMLALGLAYAESIGASDLFIGVNAVDYSGYPDCRPEYIEAFERMANLATKAGVQGTNFHIHAPLIDLTKPEIIRLGLRLGVDYALTHSCYDPDLGGHACGQCDSCLIRKKAFEELDMVDPVLAHFHHV